MEMQPLCIRCKGKGLCGKPCKILAKLQDYQPKISDHFSGSSPPEIFVGHNFYPKVFTGILAPEEYGDTSNLSMPEQWHAEQADILKIMSYRGKMIYSRFISSIKYEKNHLKDVMQEVALTSKPVSMEFKLKKKPTLKFQFDMHNPIIGNPAPLKKVRFEENPKIEKKVDYLANDIDVKANTAMQELYTSRIPVSNIIKILSAGMIGVKTSRKLVPTRWAITATDSNLSELLLDKVRYYQQIPEFMLFHAEYIGNHYEILLLPGEFSFEVIEAKMPSSVWNQEGKETYVMKDYENWHGRKDYASEVAGGYYVARLAVSEYLNAIRRQASVLVMRECRPEYWAPCGVGILRETCRSAMQSKPEKFSSLKETLNAAQTRLKLKIETFLNNSKLLSEYKKQTKLTNFFN